VYNYSSEEVVVAASIYQTSLALMAFQTTAGNFRVDMLRLRWLKDTEGEGAALDGIPLAKVGSSCFLRFYPTCLSITSLKEVTYCAIGHNAEMPTGRMSEDDEMNNNVSTLSLYRVNEHLGLSQDRIQIKMPTADGKNTFYQFYKNSRYSY